MMKIYREARKKTIVTNVIGIILGFPLGILLLGVGTFLWYEVYRLDNDGIVTSAKIIDLYTSSGKNNSISSYNVLYQYTVPGETSAAGICSTTRQINEEGYKRLVKGTEISIKYLPDRPCFSRLLDKDASDPPIFLLALLGLGLVGVGIFNVFQLVIKLARRKRLQQQK